MKVLQTMILLRVKWGVGSALGKHKFNQRIFIITENTQQVIKRAIYTGPQLIEPATPNAVFYHFFSIPRTRLHEHATLNC